MAKSQVERYEQILAGDPTSAVFVELAKSLLAEGDCPRAIEVCQRGLKHHPRSVAGRVLWGKALIHLNRPAEAMGQFDQAMALDRENPYAYNLISEVLLKRGLYRSALPILRKAAALQPNDGRVKQWLEQTQKALAGGPAPQLAEETVSMEAPPAPPPMAFDDRTVPGMQIPAELLAQMVPPPSESRSGAAAAPTLELTLGEVDAGGPPVLLPVSAASVPWPETNGAQAPRTEAATEVMRAGALRKAVAAARRPDAQARGQLRPEVQGAGGLLGELPPPEELPRPVRPVRARMESVRRAALLGDLPDPGEAVAAPVPPAPSTQAAEAMAKEYERELTRELATVRRTRGLWARHGRTFAIAAVALATLGAFSFFFVRTRQDFGGKDLKGALAEARRLIAEDTHASLQTALTTLNAAVEMDEENPEAWALTGLARAHMAADGGDAPSREAAAEALSREGVAAAHPGLKRVADVLLAEGPARAAAEEAVLDATEEDPELHTLAGQLLLARGKPARALVRFQKALEKDPGHGRALLALGDYYRGEGDLKQALAMCERAPTLHPERVLGLAEARLLQEQDLTDSLREVAALDAAALGPPALVRRQHLVLARLLSAAGRHEEALAALGEASARDGDKDPAVQLALSEVRRAAGDMAGAQAAAEAALGLQPKSETALEALGRALLGRDRERELLSRLAAAGDGRRVALMRGLARARLGEWKAARAELTRTALGGRYPLEAVVALALADAAEGASERAQAGLEKVLHSAKRARVDVRVALGRVYWQRGALDKARTQFEEAQKEPDGSEGACLLGRLYLAQGTLSQALEPLTRAVAANGSHGEAREALGQVLLGLGRLEEGLKQFEAWELDNPGVARAHRGHAHALYLLGKLQDAEGAIVRAVKLDPGDAAAHRLEAVIRSALGEPEAAFRALQRANKLDPRDAETFCEIGQTFLRQGLPDNARKAFEAALRENPRAACGRVGRHASEALEKKPSPAAARELIEVAEDAPFVWEKALARAALSRVQLARGSVKEARASAEKAVSLMPVSAQAHWALGLAALRTKDEERGHQALAQAAALDPANAPLRLALGDALARTEEHLARPIEEYEAFLRLDAPADEHARVRKLLPTLRKRMEAR